MKYLSLTALILVVGCNTYECILIEPSGKKAEYDFYNSKTGDHKLVVDTIGVYNIGDKYNERK